MCRFTLDDDTVISLLALSDADSVFALVDRNRDYLREWLAWVDENRTPLDSRRFIASTLEEHARNRVSTCAIRVHGEIVGIIGHHFIDWPNRIAHLGYWLAADWQGRGLMTRACRGFVAHAFDVLDLNRVEISCAVGNTRSRAIPKRLGFQLEGTHREQEWLNGRFVDHALYALLRREWPPD